MININSNRAKQQYQESMSRNMLSLENYYIRRIKPILNRQYFDTANMVENGIYNINANINKQADRLYSTILKCNKKMADHFVSIALSEIKKNKESNTQRNSIVGSILVWISLLSADATKRINKTTNKYLNKIIDDGIVNGKTNREIAINIRNIGIKSNKYRSKKIASTIGHSTASYSILKTIKSVGVNKKEWITARDEKVRQSPFNHVFADGEIVDINSKFIRTGEEMDYPGDPNGSLENCINCRCFLSFHSNKKSVLRRK